ncbi:MAG TPA: hypothetical protein ENO30_06960 [Thermodesulfobium narugense]|nr:hypothetical protein [Thermodesulfobium narugense]
MIKPKIIKKGVEFEGKRFNIELFKVNGQEKMAIIDKFKEQKEQKIDKIKEQQEQKQDQEKYHDIIYSYGLPSDTSKYYLAVDDGMFYIYDENNKKIAGPSAIIYPDGLVKGESIYYIKQTENGKLAIYDLYGEKISPEFDGIVKKGLIKGKGDYYTGIYKGENGERTYVLASKSRNILTNNMKTIPDPETYQEGSNYVLTYARIADKNNPSVAYTMYYVMSLNGIEASEFYTKEKALKVLEAKRKLEKSRDLQPESSNRDTLYEISI